MSTSAIFNERYRSKVGAEFDDVDQARAAAERVTQRTGIEPEQVLVIEPGDPNFERKLEPETRGIERTLVMSHVTLGLTGTAIGIVVALLLILLGIELFSANPFYSVLVFGFFGAIAGLLLGGLLSLRPDHDRLIAAARTTGHEGRWFVLVHARDHAEERRATDALRRSSDTVVRTL